MAHHKLVAHSLLLILGGSLWGLATPPAAVAQEFEPVTDEILGNPDPEDWLHWRRTLNGWGYSPLDEINRDNVHQIQLAWSWQMRPGLSEPTPLVYDGVMYLPNPDGYVQAVDARTGDLLWQHRRYLYLHDVETGQVLHQTRLPSPVQGYPVTYAVDGKQYLAIPVGGGRAPGAPNALFVFTLPPD